VRDNARQFQQLEGHLGVQLGGVHLNAALAGLLGVAATQGLEELVQGLINLQVDSHRRV